MLQGFNGAQREFKDAHLQLSGRGKRSNCGDIICVINLSALLGSCMKCNLEGGDI